MMVCATGEFMKRVMWMMAAMLSVLGLRCGLVGREVIVSADRAFDMSFPGYGPSGIEFRVTLERPPHATVKCDPRAGLSSDPQGQERTAKGKTEVWISSVMTDPSDEGEYVRRQVEPIPFGVSIFRWVSSDGGPYPFMRRAFFAQTTPLDGGMVPVNATLNVNVSVDFEPKLLEAARQLTITFEVRNPDGGWTRVDPDRTDLYVPPSQ
jgi:hypothetical protein